MGKMVGSGRWNYVPNRTEEINTLKIKNFVKILLYVGKY